MSSSTPVRLTRSDRSESSRIAGSAGRDGERLAGRHAETLGERVDPRPQLGGILDGQVREARQDAPLQVDLGHPRVLAEVVLAW